MNKQELLGLIELDTLVIQKLAQLAFFGEIQKTFNLYPGKIAEDFINASRGVDPEWTAHEWLPRVQTLFDHQLSEAQTILSGGFVVKTCDEDELTPYFNLQPTKIIEFVKNRIEQTGLNPSEGNPTEAAWVIMMLRRMMDEVIEWTFYEAARIAKTKRAPDHKILVVEDSVSVQNIIRNYLKGYDCTFVKAGDGIEGLASVQKENPTLILLDHTMPRMNGPEMLEQLRSDPKLASIPVIMMVTDGMKVVLPSGCNVIHKPFNSDKLIEMIRRTTGWNI